jgi:tetratricopeptide (TPR) repeat protein
VPREELEQLTALGYVGGANSQPPEGARPDPKDHMAEAMEMWSLMDQVGKTESLEPERRLAEILKSLGLRREGLARSIAASLLRAGRLPAARDALEPFDASPDPETQVLLGEIATAQGRYAEAEGRFRKALQPDAGGRARMGLGILRLSQGKVRDAAPWLEQALTANEALPEAWNALGVVRIQSGDAPGAISAWRRAVSLDPGLGDAWFNLALGLAGSGDERAAIDALERYLPLAKPPDRPKAESLLARLRG